MNSIRELLSRHDLPGDSGRLEAEVLLCHCLDKPRSYLFSHSEQPVPREQASAFQHLLAERRAGQPVAYLVGQREFWSLALAVNEHTLIPRPETETLVMWALELPLPAEAAVADWGTGSGAIALALASERPDWQLAASDISARTLDIADLNRRRLGLAVGLLQSDWGAAFAADCLDLVVSNPPYVAEGDPHLEAGDLLFEPSEALVSGRDGLDAIRRLVEDARAVLRPGGWLLLEHGYDQAAAVRDLLQALGFFRVTSRADLAGIERISGGCLA